MQLGVAPVGAAPLGATSAGFTAASGPCGTPPQNDGTDQVGYWLAASDGGVFAFGDAPFEGSQAGRLGSPVVGVIGGNNAYDVATADGRVLPSGGAPFHGELTPAQVTSPIVAITAYGTGSPLGYYLVSRDGAVYAFGAAPYEGSLPALGITPNAPIVGMAATYDGYWLVGADGGVYAFGQATFAGSMGGDHLDAPIVGIQAGYPLGGY